jgi:hypothetical protein
MNLIKLLSVGGALLMQLACTNAHIESTPEWNALGPVYEIDNGITPGIAMDAKGFLHLVYMNEGRIFYRRLSVDGNTTVREEIQPPVGPGDYNSPHLVIDKNDVPHVVFQKDYRGHSQRVWYTNRIGGSWKVPSTVISVSQGRANYPRIALSHSAAYIGAFTIHGDADGTVVKVVDLDKNPTVHKTVGTNLWVPTPHIANTGNIFVVGRRAWEGHFVQEFDAGLEPLGEQRMLSSGTKLKTGEPLGTVIGRNDIVHAIGISGVPNAQGALDFDEMWYNNTDRTMGANSVITGISFSKPVHEYVYPVLAEDANGLIYLSYRNYDTNEGAITIISGDGYSEPVVFAESVDLLMRWNPHIVAAPRGGVYAAWHADGTIFIRSIGVEK